MEILEMIRGALEPVLPQLQTLGALIVVDLGLGVAVAIKEKEFDFALLGSFFQERVVPHFIGWAVLTVGVELVVPEFGTDVVSDVAVQGSWAILVADLSGDILSKLSSLGIKLLSRIPGVA